MKFEEKHLLINYWQLLQRFKDARHYPLPQWDTLMEREWNRLEKVLVLNYKKQKVRGK